MPTITGVAWSPMEIDSGAEATATIHYDGSGSIDIYATNYDFSPDSAAAPEGGSPISVTTAVTGPGGVCPAHFQFHLEPSTYVQGLRVRGGGGELHSVALTSEGGDRIAADFNYSAPKDSLLALEPAEGFEIRPKSFTVAAGEQQRHQATFKIKRIGNHRRKPSVRVTLGDTVLAAQLPEPRRPRGGKP